MLKFLITIVCPRQEDDWDAKADRSGSICTRSNLLQRESAELRADTGIDFLFETAKVARGNSKKLRMVSWNHFTFSFRLPISKEPAPKPAQKINPMLLGY